MSFDRDGLLDPDEALRLLELASHSDGDTDIVLMIESKGTVVEGESARAFADGKSRMPVKGYYFNAAVKVPPGSSKGVVAVTSLVVVRESDAATASLASLLRSQATDLKVDLSVFKAGGEAVSKDAQPTLEFVLEKARVKSHTMLTGLSPQCAVEVLSFEYETLTVKSAPQQATGARGAVRTCSFTPN
jgi:type VI protein secretion system component Hcp